jgi:uncharacterized protein YbjQ (UPF0145 family)
LIVDRRSVQSNEKKCVDQGEVDPMKIFLSVAVIAAFLLSAIPVYARNTQHMYPYKELMSTDEAKTKLDRGIKFFFGDQSHPGVARKIGTWVANKKTNALNKSDDRACEWAFLSAMISLQQRAIKEGGDAVINIQSYYKKNVINSATEFECGAGTFVAGVALRGTVVKLK